MLSSRAKIRHNVARLPHVQHHLNRQQRSAGALVLNARSYAATPGMSQQEESDSIKHLIKGPVTPLTIFATSPPPEPHPSTYLVPAATPDGAALDFRLSFAFPKVQKIKEDRFKEEMGVFKILYERPFLQEYKNVMLEKQQKKKSDRIAAKKAYKEKKRLGLLPARKKSLFELDQDRQRKLYLQTLQYPFSVPDATVKGEELKKYFNFIATHSETEIHDRLYPEFFGDTRERVESLVPHSHDGYVWDTFFDPENPSEFPNQADAEGDIWDTLTLSAEEQISDLVDEMAGEQEKEARLATWELDPARFKGKWTPRAWPKEDLELSHIKQKARNLRFLREQLKKHGLLPEEDDATAHQALLRAERGEETTSAAAEAVDIDEIVAKTGDEDEDILILLDEDAKPKEAPAAAPEKKSDSDDIADLLDAVLRPTEPSKPEGEQDHDALIDALMPAAAPKQEQAQSQSQVAPKGAPKEPALTEAEEAAWRAKLGQFQKDLNRRVRDGATQESIQDDVVNFLEAEGGKVLEPGYKPDAEEEEEEEDGDTDWDAKLEDIPGITDPEGHLLYDLMEGGRAGAMQRAREREARLHRLQEHVKVPFDDSQKKQIFAKEPVPGEPSVEFIHSYSMDPDVAMGSLGRRDFMQRKVVMKVHVPSLSLPPAVQQRLVDLVGTRYDAQSGWLKLVGDKHPNRHLNQKYLTLLMRELLNESFLADSRYTPLSDLDIADPSSLRRKYALPGHLQSIFDGKAKQGGWEYKMFTFGRLDGRYPAAHESAEEAAKLRQRLASSF